MSCTTRAAKWGLLLPDPKLRGLANLVAPYPHQDEPTTPAMVAQVGNLAAAVPIASGRPDEDWAGIDVQVVTTGTKGSASYVWREKGEADDQWKGQDDYRRLWNSDSPDNNILLGRPATWSLAHHEASDQLIAVVVQEDGTVTRYAKTAHAMAKGWSSTSVTLPSAGTAADSEISRLGLVEAEDGSLLLACVHVLSSAGFYTRDVMHLYRSTDAGLTWAELSTIAPILGHGLEGPLYFARSGGTLRIIYQFGSYFRDFFSTDGGASWGEHYFDGDAGSVNFVSVTLPPDEHTPRGGAVALYALPGGRFGLAYRASGGSHVVSSWQARGDAAFNYCHTNILADDELSDLSAWGLTAQYYRGEVHVVISGADTAGGHAGLNMALAVLDPDTLVPKSVEFITKTFGAHRPSIAMVSTTGAGCMWVLTGRSSTVDIDTLAARLGCVQLGGWTTRSLGFFTEYVPDADIPFPYASWSALHSQPTVPPDTLWTLTSVGPPLYAITAPDYISIDATAGQSAQYMLTLSSVGAGFLLEGGFTAVFTCRVTSGGGTDNGLYVAVDAGELAVRGLSLWALITDVGVQLHANPNGAPSGTSRKATILTDTSRTLEVRITATPTTKSNPVGARIFNLTLAVAAIGDYYTWQTASVSLSIPAPPFGEYNGDRLYMGALGAVNGRLYDVTLLATPSNGASREYLFTNPTSLLGAGVDGDAEYVYGGVSLGWGGSAVFVADAWASREIYRYGVENAFQPSPRILWKSSEVAGGELVPQSHVYSADSGRWEHDAIYIGGCSDSEVLVEYSDDSDFLSLVATETVSMVRLAGVEATDSDGDVLTITLPAALADQPLAGEWVGHFIRFADGYLEGLAFEVTHQKTPTTLHVNDPDGSIPAGFTAGDTFDLIAPHRFHAYAAPVVARFMRVTLGDPWTGTYDHRLGVLMPGTYLQVDVPMSWTTTDVEAPNVLALSTASGMYWGAEQGPSVRAIEGQLTGGDVNQREAVRYLLRELSGYDRTPTVLVLDRTLPQNCVYGLWNGGTSFSNVALSKYSDGTGLRAIGDMTITFGELK